MIYLWYIRISLNVSPDCFKVGHENFMKIICGNQKTGSHGWTDQDVLTLGEGRVMFR